MARFCPLYSGSSGNASYVGTSGGGVLVDAGVSCNAILTALAAREIDPRGIEGIFITHEHSDHVKGLRVLLKKLEVPLFATAATLHYLVENDLVPPGAQLEAIDGRVIQLGDLSVRSFATSHDAVDSVGYRIETADGRSIGIATDLGVVTPAVQAHLSGCDLVLLEANYDTAMLRCSTYPFVLKRRIASPTGHLSNECCATEAQRLVTTGSTRFVLGHLSRENNLPALAYETIRSVLELAGCRQGLDYTLSVAPRSAPGELVVL